MEPESLLSNGFPGAASPEQRFTNHPVPNARAARLRGLELVGALRRRLSPCGPGSWQAGATSHEGPTGGLGSM